MTRIDIGPARPDELHALVALGRETYAAHYGHLWTAEGLVRHLARRFDPEAVRADLATPNIGYLVAREGTALAGYAKIVFDRPVPGMRETGIELERLYLDAARTGQGVGSALLAKALAQAREAGVCVWLDVLKSNVDAARFYARHGFQTIGELPFGSDRGEIGFWVMRRSVRR